MLAGLRWGIRVASQLELVGSAAGEQEYQSIRASEHQRQVWPGSGPIHCLAAARVWQKRPSSMRLKSLIIIVRKNHEGCLGGGFRVG